MPGKRRIIWRLYAASLVSTVICCAGTAYFAARAARGGGAEDVSQAAWLTAIVLCATVAAVGFIISWHIGRDLMNIRTGAERFAAGDLVHKITEPGSDELGGLAESLNRMAALLDEKIRTITRQSHEQQAVLSSMIEGVLAVDNDERILSLNHAAVELIGADPGRVIGRRIQEVVRNTQLQRFVARALSSHEPVEADVVLPASPGSDAGEERYLQTHGTVLRDASGKSIGALVVINDVTRMRRLENLRRDFVANVSHELKTPVTSIKGFIETLRDGAMREPDNADQFLAIISRQADRLNSIIEDLLKLSRIEQDAERSQIELSPHRLIDVLQSAINDTAAAAGDRGLSVTLDCPHDLEPRINAPLIEQAVVNLLDNAIKYTENGGVIELAARQENAEAVIQVRDRGCGIPAEHLPRLFERFYRVDKARSRKQGGTGLGLAIVKHIAQAHRGGVSVQSTPGAGSTFTIRIPVAPADNSVAGSVAPSSR
ncbi:MAG: PAS domain-containing protein [Planctomycetes bacterium]|nr:PAS domain-containing protein [Planctomycetota bacterium]